MNRHIFLLCVLLSLAVAGGLVACGVITPQQGITITLVADGTTQTLVIYDEPIVSDVLRQQGILLGELDRVNPQPYSRVTDGMTITVVRVDEQIVIEQEIVPFRSSTMPNDSLPAGETRLLQPGTNGTAEVTYRIRYENGVEVSRSEIRRIVIQPAQDEIIMIGSQGELPTVTVNGTLAYVSSGNAWIMRQNSANRHALTLDGGLDEKVFELSEDGKRLLFTRAISDDEGSERDAFNALWAILDTTDPNAEPVRLDLENILFAAWVPGTQRTIIYSTAEPRTGFPGWQANNDLWRAQISPTGGLAQRTQLLEPSSGGIYGWYGTVFAFAPDGISLAWAQPDAVGVLLPDYDREATPPPRPTDSPGSTPVPTEIVPFRLPTAYARRTLAAFAPWNAYDFIWVPTPMWSPDSALLAVVTHGEPLGAEEPEDSPVFSLTMFPGEGGYSVTLVEQAGMWAEPRFSPSSTPDGTPLEIALAFLQANDPSDSVYSRYRLVIMDRDGSNRRTVYPSEDKPGLQPQSFSWSPDGRQIALVDPGPRGNLVLVDVVTGLPQQVTSDGQSSLPRWVP